MADLEEKILCAFEDKPGMVEVHRWHFFYLGTWRRNLEKFLNKLNSFDPTIKFTAECSKETINFSDVNTRLAEGELMADFFVKPTDPY